MIKTLCVGSAAAQREIEKQVNRGGWSVITVAEGAPIPFGYTVGLHYKALPETIVIGLDPATAAEILNGFARRMIESGHSLPHGSTVRNIANLPLTVIDVDDEWKREYAIQAYGHYRHWQFAMQQLVLPDPHGRFPWDQKFDNEFADMQVVLGSPALRALH